MAPLKRIANAKLPKVEGRGLVREVFRLWLDIVRQRHQARVAQTSISRKAAEELRSRSVLSVDEQGLRKRAGKGILLRRELVGTEVWLDTLTDASTFRDMHEAVRNEFGFPPRATNMSVAVYFLSKHPLALCSGEEPEWAKNDIIQCNDAVCRRRLRGCILGVQNYTSASIQGIDTQLPGV
jgi:hypothetical protein